MMTFSYTITDVLGIHAGPASHLVQLSSTFKCNLHITNASGKEANLKNIFAVMGLGINNGDQVFITADGSDEVDAINKLKDFFTTNL